jgi:hypothetical protein
MEARRPRWSVERDEVGQGELQSSRYRADGPELRSPTAIQHVRQGAGIDPSGQSQLLLAKAPQNHLPIDDLALDVPLDSVAHT